MCVPAGNKRSDFAASVSQLSARSFFCSLRGCLPRLQALRNRIVRGASELHSGAGSAFLMYISVRKSKMRALFHSFLEVLHVDNRGEPSSTDPSNGHSSPALAAERSLRSTESRQPSWATAMAVVFLDAGDQSDFNI